MQHIDLIALRYFSETANSGSIRQASNRLHVTPSAISRRIAKLEQQLETNLFERRSTGMVLTQSGEVLAQEIGVIYRQLTRVQGLIGDLEGLRRGEVIVHCMEGAVDWWMTEVVAAYRRRYPQVSFRLKISSTDQSIEALIKGQCDIAVMFKAPHRHEIEIVATGTDPLVAVVAPSHKLAQRKSIRFSEITDYDLTLPDKGFGVRQLFDSQVLKNKTEVRCLVTTNSIAMIRSLVRNGTVATVLPHLSVGHDCKLGVLAAIPITHAPDMYATIDLCIRKDRQLTSAAQEMLRSLQKSFSSFVAEK